MNDLYLVVPGVAAPQGSFRAMNARGSGRAILVQANKRTMPWRQSVAAVAYAQTSGVEGWPTASPVEINVSFYLPRPKGHHGARGLRPSAPKFPTGKPDVDKLFRAIGDALTGIVYHDDSQIVRLVAMKSYADCGAPRTTIAVEVLR